MESFTLDVFGTHGILVTEAAHVVVRVERAEETMTLTVISAHGDYTEAMDAVLLAGLTQQS
jgi:hypothetical protein